MGDVAVPALHGGLRRRRVLTRRDCRGLGGDVGGGGVGFVLRDRGVKPSGHQATWHVRLILHRHRVAAERVHYAAHIEVLEPDHPERRSVTALCLYSHAVDTRQADRSVYDQEEAERFARELLMPANEFAPVSRSKDAELAELFAAPLDQVAIRRGEVSGDNTCHPD